MTPADKLAAVVAKMGRWANTGPHGEMKKEPNGEFVLRYDVYHDLLAELQRVQGRLTEEQVRACVWDNWPVPIKELDVTWFAGEVSARLNRLSAPTLEQVRRCEYCSAPDRWTKAYLADQSPDVNPTGIWLHKQKNGKVTMPCNLLSAPRHRCGVPECPVEHNGPAPTPAEPKTACEAIYKGTKFAPEEK